MKDFDERPSSTKLHQQNFRVSQQMLDDMRARCNQVAMTQSEYIRHLIRVDLYGRTSRTALREEE